MQARELSIHGAVEFSPRVFRDARGSFTSPFEGAAFAAATGRPLFRVEQVSCTLSDQGVLRGVHYTTTPPGMAKYLSCPRGRIRDYLVDLRIGSPTFGSVETLELSSENCRAVYVPVGVGHAFLAQERNSMVVYLLSHGYVPEHECAVSVRDPALEIPLPNDVDVIQSERDLTAPTLARARERGLLPDYPTCRETEANLWP